MLIDEQDFVRCGLVKVFAETQGIKIIAETRSYEEGLQQARALHPHVIFLDIHLPALTGLDTLRKLLRFDSDFRIIALSSNMDDSIPSMAFQAGAAGFLSKQATADDALRSVRVVHAGQRYLSQDVAQRLAFNRFQAPSDSPFRFLSEREMQVAMMIINDERAVQISHRLNLSPKTINGCRYRIYKKLGIKSDVQLLKLALIHRLIVVKSDEPASDE